jgi:type I restriction enzyme R subunit
MSEAIDKKSLSERDICTKYITPALVNQGWNINTQIREEVTLTKSRVIVRGKLASRGEQKRADYVLYYKPGVPLAVIEAKDNNHSVSAGMQQAIAFSNSQLKNSDAAALLQFISVTLILENWYLEQVSN